MTDNAAMRPVVAAEYLGLTVPTLRGLARRGLIPTPLRVSHKVRLYRRSDLDAYLAGTWKPRSSGR